MKHARATDFWRTTYSREYATAITQFSFENILGVGTGQLTFRAGISTIVGSNGVGKSTLLEAIWTCLSPEQPAHRVGSRLRLKNAKLEASVRLDSALATVTTSVDEGGSISVHTGPAMRTTFLNPSFQSHRIISLFDQLSDIEDFTEAYQPAIAAPEDLAEIGYLVGKNYTEVLFFEIADYANEPPFPYVRVRVGSSAYGTESMGLGEMALLLTWWQLRQVPKNSILLIEEPETFVVPRSQRALLNLLAKSSAEKGVWTLLTSHSPSVVARIPSSNILLMGQSSAQATFLPDPSPAMLGTITGLTLVPSGAIVVEDDVAQAMAMRLLAMFAPELLEVMEVVVEPGGAVMNALARTPIFGPWFALVGVYDGDMQSVAQKQRWPHAFLPGDLAPEKLLMSAAEDGLPDLSRLSAKTEDQVKHFLGTVAGLDHHDWLIELSRNLMVPKERLVAELTSVWVRIGANEAAAKAAVDAIKIAAGTARKRPLP